MEINLFVIMQTDLMKKLIDAETDTALGVFLAAQTAFCHLIEKSLNGAFAFSVGLPQFRDGIHHK
jgi:hypothetical protein